MILTSFDFWSTQGWLEAFWLIWHEMAFYTALMPEWIVPRQSKWKKDNIFGILGSGTQIKGKQNTVSTVESNKHVKASKHHKHGIQPNTFMLFRHIKSIFQPMYVHVSAWLTSLLHSTYASMHVHIHMHVYGIQINQNLNRNKREVTKQRETQS